MQELQSLVISAQGGDKEAFGEIVARFQDMAYAVAYAMLGDAYLAEEAAQEAFIDAYVSIHNLREPAAFPGWFRRVVVKHSDRQIRGKHLQILPLDKACWVPAKSPGPEIQVEQLQLRQAVSEAIASLSRSQRLATALYYVQGYSQKEIAEILGVPVTRIKKNLYTARQRLKRRMVSMIQDDLQANKPSQDQHFRDKVSFFIALKIGDIEQVKELVRNDPDLLGERTEWGLASEGYYWPLGITALHWAAGIGDFELASFLLDQGAEVEAQKGDKTPLHIAALMRQPEIAKLLITRGADVNSRTSLGHTPLHFAVMRNHLEIAGSLLERGAKLELADQKGRTPADWAAIKGQKDMLALLASEEGPPAAASSSETPVPVGMEILGRVLDADGKPVDGLPPLPETLWRPAGPAAPAVASPVLEMGIKIIDLLAPLKRGGQNAIFTPVPGLGKFVVLDQIVANFAGLYNGYAVCIGLEEGAFTGDSLMLMWRDWGVDKRTVNVFNRAKDSDETAMHIAQTGLSIAESFRSQGHEVLLVVDGDLAVRGGIADFIKARAIATPQAAITVMYYGDYSAGAEPASLSELHAVLTFDKERARQSLWPAIDPIRSRSRLLIPELAGERHVDIAARARRTFLHYQDLKQIVEDHGLDSLNPEDRQTFLRARRLDHFLTQPFSGAEPWTGIPGKNVSLEDTLQGCHDLLEGKYDAIAEEAFYFIGKITEALDS
ncbi:MAG TPA: sigma-70 family RNA polymerase sigma factor [Anaerolineales bacterium]|nr:sigma-70 family RNA polymerase sigma factor [Anaerolineales bacterium]